VPDETLAEALNRSCHCISVDHDALQRSLALRFGDANAYARLRETHPHLLADSPVFISREHIGQMNAVIQAIEGITQLKGFQQRVLDWVPDIARSDKGPHGVFFGYDFHLTRDGPRLIEVNTNAGGALLLVHLAGAQVACCRAVENFVAGPFELDNIEHAFVEMFRDELRAQDERRELRCIAIVDEDPETQFLRPEFTLFHYLFSQSGIETIIAGPGEFAMADGQLVAAGKVVDLVYNRLTDFYLQSGACAVLRDAYETGAAAFTPGPRTHALYANKRNLTLLGDDAALAAFGADDNTRRVLAAAVPRAELVTRDNAAALWAARRDLFFKPVWGFGSRGTFRGAKLTKKTWASILESEYIAQELVPPSERLLVIGGAEAALKIDVRCYVYRGRIQLLGARLYRGQTTNFRTDGGGLAAVFTTPHA
jgi:glutathione synthase/RimK-type ligase-like ATP-grasp enzyme